MAPHHLHAQTVGGGNASSNTESNASNDNKNSASVNTGNNVFDFSSNGANTPNGPPLPSFSGGPCLGTSASVGGSAPGISIGGGYSREDEACQRRNWVQTLIGAAQHMTPEEAALMRRLALEVMREDEYLSDAFQRLGYPSVDPKDNPPQPEPREERVSTRNDDRGDEEGSTLSRSTKGRIGTPSPTCVAVIGANSPEVLKKAIMARGCVLEEM